MSVDITLNVKTLNIGDELMFVLQRENELGNIAQYINKLIEKKVSFKVDENFRDRIRYASEGNTIHFYRLFETMPDILRILTENDIENFRQNTLFRKMFVVFARYSESKKTPNLQNDYYQYSDPKEIQKEMISKVDIDRLVTLLSIAGSFQDNRTQSNEKVAMKYLKLWAEQKWKLYVLLGRNLFVSRSIEVEVDQTVMSQKIVELCKSYPMCAEVINRIDISNFINNTLRDYNFSHEYQFLQPGMKTSKFLSILFNNQHFSEDLSIILDSRQIKTNIFLSVDPYDYCTSAMTKSGWRSCHNLYDGETASGPLCYLLDPSTIVSYCSEGNDVEYDVAEFKFRGNTKLWRQMIHVDTRNFAAILGRQYRNDVPHIEKSVRFFYHDTVNDFVGNSTKWQTASKSLMGRYTTHGTNMAYYDVNHNEWSYRFTHLPYYFKDSSLDIKIGNDYIYDVETGKQITQTRERRAVGRR